MLLLSGIVKKEHCKCSRYVAVLCPTPVFLLRAPLSILLPNPDIHEPWTELVRRRRRL